MEVPDSNSNTQGQEDCKFQATLSSMISSYLKKTTAEREENREVGDKKRRRKKRRRRREAENKSAPNSGIPLPPRRVLFS